MSVDARAFVACSGKREPSLFDLGKQILKPYSVDQMLSRQWRRDGKGLNGNSNGEVGFGTYKDYMNVWGLGVQHFQGLSGPGRGRVKLIDTPRKP